MKNKIFWPIVLILVFALSRWPGLMPPNFSATYALCFCAGLYLPRRLAWTIPFAAVITTDLLLTFFYYRLPDYTLLSFLRDQATNYIAYAALIGLGCLMGGRRSMITLVAGGILGAILFYLISNTASWICLGYEKTLAGWIRALTTGMPGYPSTWEFFRGTFLSGGIFTALFVGAMKFSEALDESPIEKGEEAPASEGEEAEPTLTPVGGESETPAS